MRKTDRVVIRLGAAVSGLSINNEEMSFFDFRGMKRSEFDSFRKEVCTDYKKGRMGLPIIMAGSEPVVSATHAD